MSVTLSTQPAAPPGALPIQYIFPSLTNPRQNFQGPEFDDLVESIRQHGVLQPVLVRPAAITQDHRDRAEGILRPIDLEFSEDHGCFELVCGERRYRAAMRAGLRDIPAVSRDLSDFEAREIQIIENLQREGIPAIEEGEAFRQLLDSMQADQVERPIVEQATQRELVQTIAQKIGKSVRYVYARMQLTGLIPEVKKALSEGRIEASHADLLVRLDPERQREVFRDEFCEYAVQGEELQLVAPEEIPSVRELKMQLENHAPQLRKAAWKWQKDESVQPSCVGCEHNTASQEGANPKDARCLNEICYAQKTKNFIDVRVVELEAKTGKAMVKVAKSDYSAPKGVKKATEWRKAPVGSCDNVMPAILVGAYDGEWEGVITVCLEKKCKEHWGSNPAGVSPQQKQQSEAADKKKAEVERENVIRGRLLKAVLDGVSKLSPEILRAFVQTVISEWDCKSFEKVLPGAVQTFKEGKTDSADFAKLLVAHIVFDDSEACQWQGAKGGQKEFHADLEKCGLDWRPLRAKFAAEYDKPAAKTPSSPEKKPSSTKKASKPAAKKKKVSAKKGGRK